MQSAGPLLWLALAMPVCSATLLAYLGGLVDGDGYFKITKNFRTPAIIHPYYSTVVGLGQLWPGEAVQVFANTFGGEVKEVTTAKKTLMARCEVRGKVAESAARRLAPFLLLKHHQALLFLEAIRLRPTRHGRTLLTERGHERVEEIRKTLVSLQRGKWDVSTMPLPLSPDVAPSGGGPPLHSGWADEETLAYLAGIMDSDGNFRVCRKHVRDMRWPNYRINIRCAQVTPSPAVELLLATFGGTVTLVKDNRPDHRNLLAWSLFDQAAGAAVKALLPYLRVKWVEACLLLQLRELKTRGKADLTVWEHRNRWRLVARMRKRSYSAEQVAEFERIRLAVISQHTRRLRVIVSAPGAPS